MSARSLNWLKFGGLVALAFALGPAVRRAARPAEPLAPPRSRVARRSAIAHGPGAVDSRRPAAAGPERRLRGGGRARQAQRGLHPVPAHRAGDAAAPGPARDGAVLLAPVPPAARDRAGQRLRLHRLGRRLHPDQQPRGRRRRAGDGPAARPARVPGQGRRHRSQHRRRRAQDRRQGRCRPWRSATATTPGSASGCWPSATRWARRSPSRSPPAS